MMALHPIERVTVPPVGAAVRMRESGKSGRVHTLTAAYKRPVCVALDGGRDEYGCPVFVWCTPADLVEIQS